MNDGPACVNHATRWHSRFLRASVGGLIAATMLLTRVPMPSRARAFAKWRWAPAWFGVIGAAIGAAAGLVSMMTQPLGAWPSAAIVLVVSSLLTGALHEDGLADTADALGGARTRAAIFVILKDSRVGSYGALAIALSVLLRASAIVGLRGAAPAALLAAHCLARAVIPWMQATLPYVTPPDVQKSAAVMGASAWHVVVCTATAAGVLAMVARTISVGFAAPLAIAAGGAVAVAWLLARYFLRRAGGITGDFLGAAEQVCEAGVLVLLLASRAVTGG